MHGDAAFLLCLLLTAASAELLQEHPQDIWRLSRSAKAQCILWSSGNCVLSRPLPPDASPTEFYWAPSSWGPCSKACGGGVQKAVIGCFANNFTKVDPSNCAKLHNFDVEKRCNALECPVFTIYRSPRTECSKTCGTGQRTRELLCKDQLGSLVDSSNCNVDISTETEPCNTAPCGSSYWTIPQWSVCDAPCGGGKQKRIPICRSDGVPVCTEAQPETEKTCNTQPCQTRSWLIGSLRNCPFVCDATAHRLVQCVDGFGFQHPEFMCSGKKPSETVSCRQLQVNCADCLNDCYGNGVCQADKCSCSKGWSGKYCHTAGTCEGLLGYDEQEAVQCCHLVDVNLRCCNSTVSVLDREGRCCESGSLDRLGICEGTAVMIDAEGKPCSTVRDEKGICCYSGFLDECHVCDGDGTSCSTKMTLYLNVTGYSESIQHPADFQLFLMSTMSRIAMKLNVADEALSVTSFQMRSTAGAECNLDALLSGPCVANDILKGLAIVNVTVLPRSHDMFLGRKEIMAALQPGSLSPFDFPEILDASLLVVSNVHRSSNCGNGICERSERCNVDGRSATTSEPSCCFQDCPYVSNLCPAPVGGPRSGIACSANGVCFDSTGQCDCYRGYGGSDCSECVSGWISTKDGKCIKLPPSGEALSKLVQAYNQKTSTMSSAAVLPLVVHARSHRRGFNLAAQIILLVLAAVCLVLLVLLAVANRMEHHRTRQQETAPTTVAPANNEEVKPQSPSTSKTFPWSSSYLGPQSDYDVIPITPMPGASGASTSRELFCASSSTPLQLELPSRPWSTEEDLTEAEQRVMVAKAKKELKKGKSSKFVTDYLTDSDSEPDGAETHECTPDSPAVARTK